MRTPARSRLSLALALSVPLLAAAPACLNIPDDLDAPDGAAAVAPSTAQELLDRHIEASGGEQALRAIDQRTTEARVVFKAQEDCAEGDPNCVWEETRGQFVLYSTADGRMYRRMVVGDNVLERGFDGENGWQMQADPQVLVVEDPIARPVLLEDALLHWYFDVDERPELALELLPSRKSADGERELDGIRWFAAGPATPESEKWFDRETGLLYEEIERDTENSDVVRRVYTDYREVDGVLAPHLIQQITTIEGLPEQVVELHVQVVHHREVRDEQFAIPELGPVEPEPDQLLATLDQAKAEAEAAPDDAAAQVLHARWAYTAAHWDEARAAAKRALKLDSDEIEAIYILARIALLEGQLKEAEKLLRKAVSSGLREDEAARQLAWIQLRRGDWGRAAEALAVAGNMLNTTEYAELLEKLYRALGARYEAFEGKPLQAKMSGGCKTTLPIKMDQGVVVVEVTADGDKLDLLLDTGAADVIVSDETAHKLVVGTDAGAPLAAGGPVLAHGQLDALEIGELTVENVPLVMYPASELGNLVDVEGVDGVLGVRPFAGRQLTVDRQNEVVEIVEPSRRCKSELQANRVGEAVPFWVHETHYLYVRGTMNQAEGIYLLNTGMRGADMFANDAAFAHAGIGAPPVRSGQPTLARVERFALGEFARADLGAAWGFFQQNTTSDRFRLDGMLGLAVLGRGRWTLDFSTQTLYLSHPSKDAAKAEPEGETKSKPEATAK